MSDQQPPQQQSVTAQTPQKSSQDQQGQQSQSTDSNDNPELYRLHASWFANLPPPADEMVIQEKAVHLIHREFLSKNVDTMPVKDIAHVRYNAIPLLAALELVGTDGTRTLKITGVPESEALHAKHIIEGLLLQKAGEVSVPEDLPPDALSDQLAQKAGAPVEQPPSES